jgi:hypothetical protein
LESEKVPQWVTVTEEVIEQIDLLSRDVDDAYILCIWLIVEAIIV